MHEVLHDTVGALTVVSQWMSGLSALLASAGHRAVSTTDFVNAAAVISSVLVAALCCAVILVYRRIANRAYRRLQLHLAHAQAEIRFREALLSSSRDAIVILGADLAENCSYRGGAGLLQDALAGADSAMLAGAINALVERGTAFSQRSRTAAHGSVELQGKIVGSRAVVFLRTEDNAETPAANIEAAVDELPAPIWVRDENLALVWANRAFLSATGAKSRERAISANTTFERSERDLASAAIKGNAVENVRRAVMVENQRRVFSLSMAKLSESAVAGLAVDVTDSARTETALRLQGDAMTEIIDHIPLALAIFGRDKRLSTHNAAFARFWKLPQVWLETNPTAEEILDRLRADRRLPERPDFPGWKRARLDVFDEHRKSLDELWNLPGTRSVHFTARPHLLGGAFWTFEDVSERLKAEAEAAMLAQAQRAMVNTIDDGMAIFGADGKLKLHNDAFAQLWNLNEQELAGEPHLKTMAEMAAERLGHDSAWNIVSAGINSSEPERYAEWSRIMRGDGKVISLSMVRLPNGATLVTFRDLTDIERFANFLKSSGSSAA